MAKAAVLSVGTELTRGELVNTNVTWICDRLTTMGFNVIEQVVVDDDASRITHALRRLSEESKVDVLVSTGGLGPTTDDLTADTVAKLLGVGLRKDLGALERMRARYASLGRVLLASSERQAEVPDSSDVLMNEVGAAPGFAVRLGQTHAFFLPGVPSEMKHIFEERVQRRLSACDVRLGAAQYLHCFGIPESELGERLQDLEEKGVTLGYRAHFPEIEVKVLVDGEVFERPDTKVREVSEEIRERLRHRVYGDGNDTFAGVVGGALRQRGWTLGVAESCTGGMVGKMLTDVPGSSDFLLFDAVVYANRAKQKVLGVSEDLLRNYGAVSSEVAGAMATGVLRVSGADLAISITGIAGPTGGTDEKPVGTVFLGCAIPGRPVLTERKYFPGTRSQIRTMASYTALNLIRKAMSRG